MITAHDVLWAVVALIAVFQSGACTRIIADTITQCLKGKE